MDHRLRYCKAFTETELARFSPLAAERARARAGAGAASPEPALYLHRDLRVRAGMFDDDPVIFETDDPGWAPFCSHELRFPPAWISDVDAEASVHAPAEPSPPRVAR